MAIMRWDPFGELLSMQRDFERLFDRLGFGRPAVPAGNGSVAWMPRVDVKTTGDDMVVYAEVPGIDPEDIDLEVTDGLLTIKGERKAETEKEEEGWLIKERSYGSFQRTLSLPEGVDPDSITADYDNGVLEIHIPKAAEALKPKTHKIALKSGKKK
ncbi:MAG: Hsp20/alpha crystallin family protein [Coriobacteriia bacterium]